MALALTLTEFISLLSGPRPSEVRALSTKSRDGRWSGGTASHTTEEFCLGDPAVSEFMGTNPISIPLDRSVYIGVNGIDPVQVKRHETKRGSNDDVARLAALFTDLDVKEGVFDSEKQCHEFVDHLSRMLGTRPIVITATGSGGLHAMWGVADGQIIDPQTHEPDASARSSAETLLRMFKTFVVETSREFTSGRTVDAGVFDLARVTKMPGSVHQTTGAVVEAYAGGGEYRTVSEWTAVLEPLISSTSAEDGSEEDPRYEDQAPDWQREAEAETMRILNGIADAFAACMEAAVDPEDFSAGAYVGPEWGTTCQTEATNLVRLALAPWSSVDLDGVQTFYEQHAPQVRGDAKWARRRDDLSPANHRDRDTQTPREMPSSLRSFTSDFTPITEEEIDEDEGKNNLPTRVKKYLERYLDIAPQKGGGGVLVATPKQGGRSFLLTQRMAMNTAYPVGASASNFSAATREAILTLEGKYATSPERDIHHRVCATSERVVLDKGEVGSSACFVVTADGWTEEPVPPAGVAFAVPDGTTMALPTPERGGDLDELADFLRWDRADERWLLVKGWLALNLRATFPRPMLGLFGPPGSSKSTTSRFIAGVVEPRPLEGEGMDLDEDMENNHLNAWLNHLTLLDNLSELTSAQSNFISRMVTSASFARRRRWTDGERVALSYRRTGIMNGVSIPRGTKPDTMERIIPVELPEMEESQRLTETQLHREWAKLQPRLLGAVLDLTAAGLAASAKTADDPGGARMADYSAALGALDPALQSAYLSAVMSSRAEIAEEDPFLRVIVSWVVANDGLVEGKMDALRKWSYEHAVAQADFGDAMLAWWPRSGRAMSAKLRENTAPLRSVGIVHPPERRAHGGIVHQLKATRPLEELRAWLGESHVTDLMN